MWFWWFMLFCDLLVPVLMILGGWMMWKHPPKKINMAIGYRTARSTKNIDTWRFAQDYCGHLWWKIGWTMLLPSLLVHLPFYGRSEGAVGTLGDILCSIQCIVMIGSIFPTERALKKTFTREGVRR